MANEFTRVALNLALGALLIAIATISWARWCRRKKKKCRCRLLLRLGIFSMLLGFAAVAAALTADHSRRQSERPTVVTHSERGVGFWPDRP